MKDRKELKRPNKEDFWLEPIKGDGKYDIPFNHKAYEDALERYCDSLENTRPQISDEDIALKIQKVFHKDKHDTYYKETQAITDILRTNAVQTDPSLVEALNLGEIKKLIVRAWKNGLCSFHDIKTRKTYNAELSDFMDEIEDDIQALAQRKEAADEG